MIARDGPGEAARSLPVERTGRRPPPELAQRRLGLDAAIAAGAWRTDPQAEAIDLGGVKALRLRAPGAARGIVMHLHGGGFRLGCPQMAAPFAAALAAECAVDLVLPAYRLAPEHPFPGGLADALRAFTALRAQTRAPIIVSGDSAGGGLAAALTGLVKGAGGVAGLVALSAWLDLRNTSAAYRTNAATDPLFSWDAAVEAAGLYLQDHSAEDPLASPLLGDLAGYPPTLVSAGAGEVLVDDSRRFHQALRQAGVEAVLSVVPGMKHTAVVRAADEPGSRETFAAIAGFIDRVLPRPD